MEGKKVLLVDLDPQADLSTCFGYGRTDEIDTTVSTMMTKSINEERFNPAEGFIQSDEGITLLPANLELSAMEMSLVSTMNRERILKGYLDRVKDNFDFVVIDCMPSLGMININYFPKELQESLADNMAMEACTPSHDQTIRMRRLLREEKLTPESIAAIMQEEKPNLRDKVVLKSTKVASLFPRDLPVGQREDFVVKAMEYYNRYLKRQREMDMER